MKKDFSLFRSIWNTQQSDDDHSLAMIDEHLSHEQLLHILAIGLYTHLEQHARQSGCCIPRLGIYCEMGKRIKQDYLEAVKKAHHHVH
ncbi:MAG: hypothetical protein AB2651_22095 [Candidatus Thiodiazotropha sp.]